MASLPAVFEDLAVAAQPPVSPQHQLSPALLLFCSSSMCDDHFAVYNHLISLCLQERAASFRSLTVKVPESFATILMASG